MKPLPTPSVVVAGPKMLCAYFTARGAMASGWGDDRVKSKITQVCGISIAVLPHRTGAMKTRGLKAAIRFSRGNGTRHTSAVRGQSAGADK